MPTFILTGKDINTREGWLHEDGSEITEAEWLDRKAKSVAYWNSHCCICGKQFEQCESTINVPDGFHSCVPCGTKPPPDDNSWILEAAKEVRELAQSNIPGLSINDPEEMKEMETEIAAIIAKWHAGGK